MVEGILNIDKPTGMTSHDVVARVRRVAGLRRVGHTGTLDPLATGVLVVCLGKATRLVEYVVGRPKTYEAEIRLGESTNTYDSDGEITAERPLPGNLSLEMLETHLEQFRGQIEQVPPMYSAIKQNGQPLYKLARQGKTVERPKRQVTIYQLDILQWSEASLSVRVVCSAGTYIRSIAHDLGESLGCGAHLTGLRRTAVGEFSTDNAVALDDLAPENVSDHLLAADLAVNHMAELRLDEAQANDLRYGRVIADVSGLVTEDALVRAYTPENEFMGLLRGGKDGRWHPHKLFLAT